MTVTNLAPFDFSASWNGVFSPRLLQSMLALSHHALVLVNLCSGASQATVTLPLTHLSRGKSIDKQLAIPFPLSPHGHPLRVRADLAFRSMARSVDAAVGLLPLCHVILDAFSFSTPVSSLYLLSSSCVPGVYSHLEAFSFTSAFWWSPPSRWRRGRRRHANHSFGDVGPTQRCLVSQRFRTANHVGIQQIER